jgi:hypothetical protein
MEHDVVSELLEWVRSHYFGKYRGTVEDTDDPTARGRLLVRVPAVLGTQTVWAMPCVPYAGPGVGFYSLPPAKAGVWVEFEGGDPSYPVWTGCFWADGELPDDSDADVKIWKTDSLTVRLDDGADEILLENGGGSTVTLADGVKSESGGATHDVGSGGVVSAQGIGKLEVAMGGVKVNDGAWEVT